MEKSKENKIYKTSKGITLIPLLITVAVMLIIVGIALENGLQSADNARLQNFFKELQIIQKRVDIISEEAKNATNKYITYDSAIKKFYSNELGRSLTSSDNIADVDDKAGYYYYDEQDLNKLGIKDVKQQVYINWETRDVVSVNGFTANGTTYYRDPSTFKPQYKEERKTLIIEEENIKIIGKSIKQVQIVDLETTLGDSVQEFEMKYREYADDEKNAWKVADNNSFQTVIPGEYEIQISRKSN